MTFTVLIVSKEQNEEFQESRVHYTLAGIKSLLKIGEGGSLAREGGFRNPCNPSPATPLRSLATCPFSDSAIILLGTKSVVVLRLLRTSHEMPYLTGPFLSLFLRKMQFRSFDETPEI